MDHYKRAGYQQEVVFIQRAHRSASALTQTQGQISLESVNLIQHRVAAVSNPGSSHIVNQFHAFYPLPQTDARPNGTGQKYNWLPNDDSSWFWSRLFRHPIVGVKATMPKL